MIALKILDSKQTLCDLPYTNQFKKYVETGRITIKAVWDNEYIFIANALFYSRKCERIDKLVYANFSDAIR